MEIKFTKKDFWLAVLGGEIVAWLSLPTLKNLKILDILAKQEIGIFGFSLFWAIFIPSGAILGLGIFYFVAKKRNQIGFFQLGKYGVIGVLNTFLNAGIYNFLIYITNIALGLFVDLFFVAAFVITVINSFFWNRFWSFSETKTDTVGIEAFRFFAVSAFVAVINTGILHFIVNIVGAPVGIDPKIWANIALIFAIIVALLGNFFGYKYIVFRK